jgi:hypothetical protein
MKTKRFFATAFLVLAGLSIVVVAIFSARGPSGEESGDSPTRNKADSVGFGTNTTSGSSTAALPGRQDASPEDFSEPTSVQVREELLGLLSKLRAGTPADEVRAALRRAKKVVHAASPDEAAGAIIELLESGLDAGTGLAFVVGPEGVMEESPTWRTALLDFLGQTDPTQFIAYSRVLMATTASSDEYALSLRNLGWGNVNGRFDGEIRDHFAAMLNRSAWYEQPTVGYLEAFDLAVESGAVNELASVLRAPGAEGELAVSRAAFVALDRLMLRSPEMLVDKFLTDPGFLSSTPLHRASLLARLDVREPEQSELLSTYLQRGDHASGELEYFADLFPNGNCFTSHRLVTAPEASGSIADMTELDRATLEALREWSVKPEFAARRGELSAVIERLEDAVHGGRAD